MRDEMETRLNDICDGKTLGFHSHNIVIRVNHCDLPPPSSFPTLMYTGGTFLRSENLCWTQRIHSFLLNTNSQTNHANHRCTEIPR